jgi:hypothetical protein
MQVSFLRWLFSGDGSVKQNGNGFIITYSSKSLNLMNDLQVILMNFGVLSSIRPELRKDYPGEAYYELRILSESNDVFLENIGFVTTKKRKRCVSNVKYNISCYFVGHHKDRIKDIVGIIKKKKEKTFWDNKVINRFTKKRLSDDVGNVYLGALSKYDSFLKFMYENKIVPLTIKPLAKKY